MKHDADHHSNPAPDRQRGRITLQFGKQTRLDLAVDISSAGLLSIGTLVAMTLLSTAVLVRAAGADRKRANNLLE